MGLRTFIAPDGAEWRVWNVVPSLALNEESREWERRGQDVFAYDGPERREQEDEGRRHTLPFVSPQLSSGWLCFESAASKRRLAPTPADWEEVPDAELVSFWETAEPVAPRKKIQIPGIAPHRLP